jgi:hypothetical protein
MYVWRIFYVSLYFIFKVLYNLLLQVQRGAETCSQAIINIELRLTENSNGDWWRRRYPIQVQYSPKPGFPFHFLVSTPNALSLANLKLALCTSPELVPKLTQNLRLIQTSHMEQVFFKMPPFNTKLNPNLRFSPVTPPPASLTLQNAVTCYQPSCTVRTSSTAWWLWWQ